MTQWINAAGRVALMPAASPRWSMADARVAEALQHLDAGALRQAATLASEALGIDPASVPALHVAGTVSRRMGRLDNALAALGKARELAPDDHRVANDLGLVLQDLGRSAAATEAFAAARALAPTALAPAVNEAAALLRLRRYPAAVEVLKAVAEQHPRDSRVVTNLAVAQEAAGFDREAARSVGAALKLDADSGLLVTTAARLERRAGQQDKAERRLERWLQQAGDEAPDREKALFELGRVADVQNRTEAAVEAFRRAGRLRARRLRERVDQEAARAILDEAMARIDAWFETDAETARSGGAPAVLVGAPGAGVGDLARTLKARLRAVVIEEASPLAHMQAGWPATTPDGTALAALRQRYLELVAEHDRPSGARHVVDAASSNLLQIDRVLTLFPRARVLMLVRHPADLLLAARTQAWETNALGAALARDEDALEVFDACASIARRLARRLGDRFHLLRAESLAEESATALDRAIEFLRIPTLEGETSVAAERYEGLAHGRFRDYPDWLSPHHERLAELAKAQGYPVD